MHLIWNKKNVKQILVNINTNTDLENTNVLRVDWLVQPQQLAIAQPGVVDIRVEAGGAGEGHDAEGEQVP